MAALEIVEEFGCYLGQALVNLAATIDPAIFVIGGGVSKAGNILLDIVKKYFYEHAFYGNHNTKIALATLGNDAEYMVRLSNYRIKIYSHVRVKK